MPNNLFTMESVNIFAGDHEPDASNHLSIGPLKLPGLEKNFADHIAGGAPMGVEIDTHLNRLEASFSLLGWNVNVSRLMGEWAAAKRRYTARGVIRERRTGKPMQALSIIEGHLGSADPTEFTKGSNQMWNYSIRGITHYELYMDNIEEFYWDFFESTYRVGGKDRHEVENRMLGIPTGQVAGGGLPTPTTSA